MNDNRNMFVALGLSAAFMIGWYVFLAAPEAKLQQQKAQATAALQHKAPEVSSSAAANVAPPPGAAPVAVVHLPRAEALARSGERIAIKTPTLDGSLRLTGARFDDLKLKNYHETIDPKSPEIELLSPFGTDYPYFVQFEWTSSDRSVALPNDRTPWKLTKGDVLSPGHPVVLSWDNGQGLTFTRTITIDPQYMFTVTDDVAQKSGKPVTLIPYARSQRLGVPPDKKGFTTMLLHQGFVGVASGAEQEAKYTTFDKEPAPKEFNSTGGWLAITDKYWMSAIIPPQKEAFNGAFRSGWYGQARVFQTDYTLAARNLTPGKSISVTHHFFGGAKIVDTLRHYESSLNIEMFDYATDWGTFWMFTRPLFWVLNKVYQLVGNFGLAIILATILLRGLLFPLANASFKSMGKMKKVQPQMEAIKKRFADDPQKQQQEMMELYKREKVNPVAGCLPMLVQFPILFAFYKVQIVTIEMFHTPFWGWISDLSAPDPTSYLNLFGLLPFAVPTTLPGILGGATFILHVGLWPILMGMTQWVQFKMNPAPTDPVQAKMFGLMPLIFTFMFATFPSGLVIYYTWNNILSMAQQGYMMKREGVPIHLFENLKPPVWAQNLIGKLSKADK